MPFDPEKYKDDEIFTKFIEDALAEATKALVDTNAGLMSDLKKKKDALSSFDGLDVDELKGFKTKYDDLIEKQKAGETDTERALRIANEKHKTEMEGITSSVEKLMNQNKALLVDGTLKSALIKANIKPELMDAATQLIKSSVSVLDEGGKDVAKIGDQTIPEYVGDWANTPVGKNFILAPNNSGGGAGGSGGGLDSNEQEKFFDPKSKHFNLTEQVKVKRVDAELHASLKKKYSDDA